MKVLKIFCWLYSAPAWSECFHGQNSWYLGYPKRIFFFNSAQISYFSQFSADNENLLGLIQQWAHVNVRKYVLSHDFVNFKLSQSTEILFKQDNKSLCLDKGDNWCIKKNKNKPDSTIRMLSGTSTQTLLSITNNEWLVQRYCQNQMQGKSC